MTPPWDRYLCEYRLDGETWSVEFPSASREDASRRLRAIGTTGIVLGPIVLTIETRGLLARLIAWWWRR